MQTELDTRYYIVKRRGVATGAEYYITKGYPKSKGYPKWNHVITSCADREEAERYIKLLQGS